MNDRNERKPPKDEVYRGRRDSEKKKKDKIRELRQYKTISAIFSNFAQPWECMLFQVKEGVNFDTDRWGFLLKGLVRCAMLQDGTREWHDWRRLLGTQKDHWIKTGENGSYTYLPPGAEPNLPTGWRSRINFLAFGDPLEANNKLAECPMIKWKEKENCPLVDHLPESGKIGLIQVHDLRLEPKTKMFSDLIQEVLNGSADPKFKFLKRFSCTACIKAIFADGFKENLEKDIAIDWEVIPQGPMISGVSQDFAKAFRQIKAKKASFNLYLANPNEPERLNPAIMVSSIKGVIRSAMGWLFEIISLEMGLASPCTSDYWRNGEWPSAWQCPLRLIFGGPMPGTGNENETIKSQRGLIRFSSRSTNNNSGSYIVRRLHRADWQNEEGKGDRRYPFARSKNASGGYDDGINIETLESDSFFLRTEIEPGPCSRAALTALCLAADLLGAGFFRVGRFTTRGFGAVRLTPSVITNGRLVDFINGTTKLISPPPQITGLQLLQNELPDSLKINDPLGMISQWIKGIIEENQKHGR
jgi:hypothetical protein